MPPEFYPGCKSREEELALLSRMAQDGQTATARVDQLQGELSSMQSAVGAAVGGGEGAASGPAPPVSATPIKMPDPLEDPEGFAAAMAQIPAQIDRRFQEQDERTAARITGDGMWREFAAEHPDLAAHENIVGAVFNEINAGGNLPSDRAGLNELKTKLADRMHEIGIGTRPDPNPNLTPDPAAAIFGQPGVQPDRTGGIAGGSHNYPMGEIPAPEGEQVDTLIDTMKKLREAPEMVRFWGITDVNSGREATA